MEFSIGPAGSKCVIGSVRCRYPGLQSAWTKGWTAWVGFMTDAHTIIEFLRDSLATECERGVTGLVIRVELVLTREEILLIEPRHTPRGTGF